MERTCPKVIDGLPVVCTWEKNWQKRMADFIEKEQDFILLGEQEYLEQVKKAYVNKSLKELIKVILLGGAGALALPGITSTSLSVALGLGLLATVDPEPVSKTALTIAVGAIVGVTAVLVIWGIIKLLKGGNVEFVFRTDFKDIGGVEVHFRTE